MPPPAGQSSASGPQPGPVAAARVAEVERRSHGQFLLGRWTGPDPGGLGAGPAAATTQTPTPMVAPPAQSDTAPRARARRLRSRPITSAEPRPRRGASSGFGGGRDPIGVRDDDAAAFSRRSALSWCPCAGWCSCDRSPVSVAGHHETGTMRGHGSGNTGEDSAGRRAATQAAGRVWRRPANGSRMLRVPLSRQSPIRGAVGGSSEGAR